MGMFDELKVEYPMPDPRFQGRIFQTKDTPNQFLDLYVISRDGRLLHEEYDMVTVPDEERPGYQEYKETGEKLHLLGGSFRKENKSLVDTNYHGDIEFCDWEEKDNTNSKLLLWCARFTDGQLQWIKQIEEE